MTAPRALTPAQHALAELYHLHHFACRQCIAAGRGAEYGTRCAAGAPLWKNYQDAE